MAEVRCPLCGRINPDDLDYCQFCDARLKQLLAPSPDDLHRIQPGQGPIKRQTAEFEKVKPGGNVPIHAGEEPTKKDTGDLERALPSWLKGLRGGVDQPAGEQGAPSTGAAAPAASEPDAESLDWLAGLESVAADDEDPEVADWMAGLRPPTASAPTPDIQSAPEQDWLSHPDVEEPPAAQTEPEKEAQTSDPDWLERLSSTQPSARLPGTSPFKAAGGQLSEPPEETTPVVEPVPDWLAALKPEAAEPAAAPDGGGDDLPDWLSTLPSIPVSTTPEEAAAAEPDWLSNLKGLPAASEYAPGEAEGLGSDWPASTGNETSAAASVFTEPIPAAAPSGEVPDWLSKLQSDVSEASRQEMAPEEFETAREPFPADKPAEVIPDWLSSVEAGDASAASTPALVLPEDSGGSSGSGQAAFSLETPDWLSKLRPEKPVEAPSSTSEEPQEAGLEAADLPSWVQAMRPVESVIVDAQPTSFEEIGAAEATGPLAGMRGVLPASTGMAPIRKPPAYAIKLQMTSNQQRYAAQLERMIVEEGQPREVKPVRQFSNQLWRILISLILIAAVLLPLMTGMQLAPDMVLYPSEWEATSQLLDSFRPEAPILIVFDYDPALSGELQAAAAPVIDHILYRNSRLALLSTSPTGPALAEQFLVSTQKYHLDTGLLYTNLGYLAGGPAGIRLFASDPHAAVTLDVDGSPAWGSAALQGVGQLSDFAALILLTDDADTGRLWIEQTRAALGTTPLLMIISAQAEPMIRPYFDAGQIQGLVTGLAGGKAYEQTYAAPGLARRYWDSFGLGTLAALIIISIGGAMGALASWRARRKV